MKKFMTISLIALIAVPAWATTTRTTTTSTYEESAPVMETDMESNSEMIEAQEADDYDGIEDNSLSTDEANQTRLDEEQKMEERNQNSSTIIESEDAIDYSDRTRTNRARKALNTGSDASDDE